MENLRIPLTAHKLHVSQEGRDVVEFTRAEAMEQLRMLQEALGETVELPDPQKPVHLVFYDNGTVIYEREKRFKLAKKRHALLKLVYDSPQWSVTRHTAMREVWETGIVDENVINNMMRKTNLDLEREGMPFRLHWSNFFICLEIYKKST